MTTRRRRPAVTFLRRLSHLSKSGFKRLFKGGGTALSPPTKFRVYCSVKEAMRKAKELLDEVPPDEIPTVIAVKIMQYETAAMDAKEVLTQALAQADKKHEEEMSAQALTYEKEKIEFRRAHFQRLGVVSQRGIGNLLFSMVAALQDRGIQEQLNATLSGNHWRLVTELINPKNEYLSMIKVNELLVLPEARNILWSAINFPGNVENYPVLDDQLLCGALPNIWRNLESNRVFEYSEEDAGMGEQLEK